MATKLSATDRFGELAARFGGTLLQPNDAGYDDARRVHNGLIDRRPRAIARCRGTADVVYSIRLARESGLEIAVRGGGHNVSGRSTVDAGLMIDLSTMRAVLVDAKARTARAQGGATWALFNRETQLHGLATTGGVVSSTGIGGLTLGGGLGWLMGKHALALDNLLSVELVLADGRVVTASAQENPELFWAVRGGGGNFGVATALEYRLHPIGPTVTGGLIVHPLAAAWDVLRYFRDLTASLPDEFMVFAGLVHAPDGSGTKLVGLVVCHCGAVADGARAVEPIKRFGAPAMDGIGPLPYEQLNSMLDGAYPRGALNYWKSSFLAGLSDEAIRTAIDCFARCPSPMSQLLLEHFHGAVSRVGVADTAFPHRAPGYNLVVLSQWAEAKDTAAGTAWAKETYAAMQPFMGASRYVNYMADDEREDALSAAYGPNLRRLQRVKAAWDPDNVFRRNHNVPPMA